MKRWIVLTVLCCLSGGFGRAQQANVRVDLNQPGEKIVPGQFGIFLEEINHAGGGGLLAELIRNGSFAEADTLDAWSAIQTGSAKAGLFFDTETPLNAVKQRSLRIEIQSENGERAGLCNEGYWGIALKKDESYRFSMYARSRTRIDGPLTVSLESKDGAIYGQTEISGLKPGWSRFNTTIKVTASDPAARLTITAKHSGTFWIDVVSLRPASDIFRPDLLAKLKDLKPGFVRFPGGTYVQGNDRESAFRWKKTIGDIATRAGHFDAPWSYWSDDSMGFYEYLLLCDRLGATPLYVAYAGMTWTPNTKSPFGLLANHKIPVSDYPLEEMGPIVQDTLDAIEFANGPVTSKWGALRASEGHPSPFELKYVEIGNEDERNPLYPERYTLMYNAIKARYPEIQIIANAHRGTSEQLPMDLVDEHIYARPTEAIDMARRLDDRGRGGPKSALEEYAVQTSAGFGNLRAALAEAVMLEGIERNSDVMPMASYAPLLANVHAINWRPDLIYFDSNSSYGTPSYYVQKMFADARIETTSPVQVNADELKIRPDGAVAAEGYGSQAEFQDGKVTGTADNYIYTVRARKTGGDGGLVIRFAEQDGEKSYLAWFLGVRHRANTLLVWGGGGNQDVPAHQLESSFGGALAPAVVGAIDTDRWYDLKIQVEGRHVQCFLDDKKIHDVQVPESLGPSVYAEAGRTAEGDAVIRLVNTSPLKQNIGIDLSGAGAGGYSGTATYLTSANLDDENSLEEPLRIAPILRPMQRVDGRFHYEVEGNSFTVFKLTPERK